MHPFHIKVGMRIKIISLATTHHLHNSNSRMSDMVGRHFTVSEVKPTQSGKASPEQPFMIIFKEDIDNYVWDPEDLEYAGPPNIKKAPVTFDPKNLII